MLSQPAFWLYIVRLKFRKLLVKVANCISDYSVLLYQGLGFKGSLPLILAAAYVSVAMCGNYINSILIDRVGRVRLLCKLDKFHCIFCGN